MKSSTLMKTILCAIAVAALVSSSPLQAQTLYAASTGLAQGQGPSDLYMIDPTDGSAQLIGPIGFNNVTGMAFLSDGRLVATYNADLQTPPGPAAGLLEIDPMTGAGTPIGIVGDLNLGDCGRMPGLTYDATSDTLYAYGDFCGGAPEGLHTVDQNTGAGTPIGPSGYTGGGNGIAIDPTDGTIYGTPFDIQSLVTIDPNTGLATDVPGSAGNVPFRIGSLAFQPGTNVLFGTLNDGVGGFLVSIDPTDGTTVTVGPTVVGLDALAFEGTLAPPVLEIPVSGPIGTTVLVLLLGATAAFMLRRLA